MSLGKVNFKIVSWLCSRHLQSHMLKLTPISLPSIASLLLQWVTLGNDNFPRPQAYTKPPLTIVVATESAVLLFFVPFFGFPCFLEGKLNDLLPLSLPHSIYSLWFSEVAVTLSSGGQISERLISTTTFSKVQLNEHLKEALTCVIILSPGFQCWCWEVSCQFDHGLCGGNLSFLWLLIRFPLYVL